MDASEFLRIDASWVRGVTTQKGLLVVRPTFAVWAATETPVNVVAALAVRITPGKYLSVKPWLTALAHLPAAEFDAQLWHAAQAASWWVATHQDSTLLFKKVPLFRRYKLGLKRGDENVVSVFGVPMRHVQPAEGILAGWPRRP